MPRKKQVKQHSTLLGALSRIYDHHDPAERQVLLEALRRDMPDLDLILEQARGQHPLKTADGRTDSLLFPIEWQLATPERAVALRGRQRKPEAMTMTAGLFQSKVGDKREGREWAALFLADWMFGANEMGRDDLARLDTLLGRAEPARVAHYLNLLGDPTRIEEGWMKASGAKNDTMARMHALFGELKASFNPVNNSGGNPEQLLKKTPVPEGGHFAETLENINLLRQRLRYSDHAKDNPVDGKWLNQPKVWQAVRDTGQQLNFLWAAQKAGASLEDKQVAPPSPVGGKLAWLEQETQPEKTPRGDLARKAVAAYINSIESKQEVSHFLHAILLNEVYGERTPTQPLLELFGNKAQALGYTLQDALPLLEWMGARRGASMSLLTKAMGPQTTPQALGELFETVRHTAAMPMLLKLTTQSLDQTPSALDSFSDAAVFNLVETMQRHHFDWTPNEEVLKSLQDRFAHNASLDDKLAFWDLHTKGSTNKISSSILSRFVNGNDGDAVQEAILARNNIDDAYRLTMLADRLVDTRRVADIVFQRRQGDLSLAKRLLGYNTGNDKAQAIASMSDKEKMALLQQATRQSRFYGQGKESDIIKNIAFDMVEAIPERPSQPLSKWDSLVQSGVAREGDLLTWRAALTLIAPFLRHPRPDLNETNKRSRPSGRADSREPVELNEVTLRQRIFDMGRHGGPAIPIHGGPGMPMPGYGPRHDRMMPGRMIHPMLMMANHPMAMEQSMLEVALAREVYHNIFDGQWFSEPKPQATEALAEGKKAGARAQAKRRR